MREVYRRIQAYLIDHGLARGAIVVVKGVHTLIFVVMMGFVMQITLAGMRGRFTRRTALASAVILGEGAVLALNHGRCPLTDLVEDLGSEHGSVSDIFLPDAIARNIPQISSTLLGLGLVAWVARRLAGREH